MARPIKTGLEYFPFDVDFFNDEKIVAVAGEFGLKGELATIKLLCAVYRNGYYVEWTEMLKFKLLKELPGVSVGLLEQIVGRLVKWGFFDSNLFENASVLTSRGIQLRYQAIRDKMHRKNLISDYSLLGASDVPEAPAMPKPRKCRAPKTRQDVEPTIHSVAKEVAAHIALDDSVKALLDDSIWYEPVCMRFGLTVEQFKAKMANFREHCVCMGRTEHKDLGDVKRHFCSWLSDSKTKNAASRPVQSTQSSDYTYSGGFGSKDK